MNFKVVLSMDGNFALRKSPGNVLKTLPGVVPDIQLARC